MLETFKFTPKTLRQVQLKGLEMLMFFDQFCKKNNLEYFLCGGCCIGSIRNKGFIPWDDDVDIFMKREHYEKLEKLWHENANTKNYSFRRPNKNIYYKNLFATISDNNTTYIKTHQANLDINHGLVMDILPLDGYPNSRFKRKIQIFWALLFSLFCAQMIPENHGKFIAFLGKLLLTLVPSKNLRYKIFRLAEKQMSKHNIEECENITELCSGPFYMMKKYPKSAFKKAKYVDFEGTKMPIPIGYEDYLSIAFGDFKKLPPKEKQTPHHDLIFCDMEKSYKKYKGIYYLKKEK